MGEPWKMFTKTQGQELIDNTMSIWTTVNGANGRIFYSKTYLNNYIFFPAGGYCDVMHHSSEVQAVTVDLLHGTHHQAPGH